MPYVGLKSHGMAQWHGIRKIRLRAIPIKDSPFLYPLPMVTTFITESYSHQGYAEQTPVVGRYVMSEDNILSLITEYGTVYSEEKFWFPDPDICLRAGLTTGLSNISSFCTETRHLTKDKMTDLTEDQIDLPSQYFSFFGG